LREQVTNPEAVDQIIHTVASTPNLSPEVAAEAVDLDARIASHHATRAEVDIAKRAESTPIDELLVRAEHQSDDAEVQNAAAEIAFFHHRSRSGLLENAAKLSGSAHSWYRLAQNVADEFQRSSALHRSIELDRNYLPAELEMARRYAAQGQSIRSRQVLETSLRQHPNDPFVSAQLAQLDVNAGRAAEALMLLRALTATKLPIAASRQVAEIYLQLGFLSNARDLALRALNAHRDGLNERELILRIDKQSGNVRELKEDYALFARVEPHPEPARANVTDDSRDRDPQSQSTLDLLHGRSTVESNSDSEYLVNVAEALARWRSLPSSSRIESRSLADVRIEKLRDDYQSVQHFQQLIAVGSVADIGAYSQKAIQYSPDSQQLTMLKARIHRMNGRVTAGEDLGETSVAEPTVAMYYDLRAHQYRFPDLRAGDVVELEYTIAPLSRKNPYGNYFAQIVAFGSALPTDLQRYVLRAPAALHLNSAEQMVPPPLVRGQGDEIVSIWEKKQIAGLELEEHAPSWSEQGAYIHISNFDSWESLGRWYAALIAPQFKLDQDLDTVVSRMIDQHPNRLDRIAAIDELVLKSTRYVALEFGVYGLKPYPVSQTFGRKFGDCKDKASLMVALLRGAGIDADLALVRTRHLGSFVEIPASVSIFDHAIVYVPEFDLWLDGTAEFSRLRELPVQDQGVMALTIDSNGEALLRKTPVSTVTDNFSRRTIDATIEADGQIHFSGATYIRGDDAPELRRELDPRDGKLSYVRERLAQVLPAVEVRHVELPQAFPDAVALSFSGDLSVFQGKSSATLPSSWMRRDYVSTLAPSGTRSQDLLLDAPWSTEEEIHIQIPSGARATQLPRDQVIEAEFGRASVTYKIKDHEITIFSHVEFDQTRVTVAQYNAFREFTVQLEETFHRNITVELR
jgi:tetratricopeptide (TPR) repeat protein